MLNMGELIITDDLTISGPGAAELEVDGDNKSRVLRIDGAAVSISGLTITGGADFDGGGIYNSGGVVTVESSSISGNGGAGQLGAGLGMGIFNNQGTLILNNSTVADNGLGVQQPFMGEAE